MEIDYQSGRWTVELSWSEVHEAHEESSPAERAISAVADRHEVAADQLRSSVIRAHEDGMTVVVDSDG